MGLEAVELTLILEDDLGISLPDADWEHIRTVGDVVEACCRARQVRLTDRTQQRQIAEAVIRAVAEIVGGKPSKIRLEMDLVRDLNFG